jgi:hypothetical protein
MSERNYWLLFLTSQIVGATLPSLGNVHLNIVPLLIGGLLLFPGILIELVFPPNPNTTLVIVSVVFINTAAWYFLRKILLLKSTVP